MESATHQCSVRIAVAGAGAIGRRHIELVQAGSQCVLAAIVDPAQDKRCASYPDEDCHVIAGTHGSLPIPTMRLKTYSRDANRSWWAPFDTQVEEIRRDAPLERQLDHFCAVMRGEAQPLITVHDGLQNLRIVEAIAVAAHRHGRRHRPPQLNRAQPRSSAAPHHRNL